MADDVPSKAEKGNAFIPPSPAALVRIIPEIPVIFADGVWNQVRGPGVSKFHFFRNDASLEDTNIYSKIEVLQVIMPPQAFVDMVAFFDHRLKTMVKKGNITQEMVDERRNL